MNMENNKRRFNRIVVGVDGSAGANRATAWAIQQAKRTGAEIVAVYVGQPPYRDVAAYGFVAPLPLPDWQDEARGLFLEDWCLPLRSAGARYRATFIEGTPGPELVAIADREGAGLIVTGSRGLGAVREAILGSVSHYLMLHSDVPVVVVPPERRVRERAAQELTRPIALPAPAGVLT
jgi:nucleotide-binding universal stress UspA family protein